MYYYYTTTTNNNYYSQILSIYKYVVLIPFKHNVAKPNTIQVQCRET